MQESVKIAYAEIFEILSYMEKSKVMQVPFEILQNFKENRKKDYVSKIDKQDIYNKNNISKETLQILAYLNVNYWVDEEKKKELLTLYRNNEIEKGNQLKEQYATHIFETKEKSKEVKQEIMIVKKENIFEKFFRKLREKIFHKYR